MCAVKTDEDAYQEDEPWALHTEMELCIFKIPCPCRMPECHSLVVSMRTPAEMASSLASLTANGTAVSRVSKHTVQKYANIRDHTLVHRPTT